MSKFNLCWATISIAASAFALGARAQVAPAAPPTPTVSTVLDALVDGKPIVEVRARYEEVDQKKTATIKDDAEAYTVRTHFGWQTDTWEHLQLLVEGSNVSSVAAQKFAVNVPGATTPPLNGASKSVYPLVNDPNTTEFNRAQITWSPSKTFSATVGRQRILIDDQRFVGNVNWRQDEQTFNAVRADVAVGGLKVFAAYVSRINRTLAQYRDFDSDSYLINARYDLNKSFDLEAFEYLLRFENSSINSSQTRGVRVSGKYAPDAVKWSYDLTYARQGDYGNAPTPFGLDFYALDVAGAYGFATVKFDYQQLNGNGKQGFTTPLATTHGFQGWADAFVSPGGNKSFVDGIIDYNVALVLRAPIKPTRFFSKPELTIVVHDFEDERRNSNIGHEWDMSATANVTDRIVLLLKYADFKRDLSVPLGAATPPASRNKVWLSVEFKL